MKKKPFQTNLILSKLRTYVQRLDEDFKNILKGFHKRWDLNLWNAGFKKLFEEVF